MKKTIFLIILFFNCQYFKSETKYFEVTAKSGLILRKGPGQNFEKITTLPTKTYGKIIKFVGETVKIQGKTGRWIEVETKYLKGFIFSGFIKIHNNDDFLNIENDLDDNYDQNNIGSFIQSNKSKDELAEIFKESYKNYEKDLELNTKQILDNEIYSMYLFSLSSPKDQYTNYQSITLYNKKKKINFIPDSQNFHPLIFAENSKIIFGKTYECYECCAMPSNLVSFLAEDKVYSFYAPLEDTEPFCGVDGEYYDDFSQLRITQSNDVIIHRISYECPEILKCPSIETEGGCIPSKILSDQYTLIENPFKKPKTSRFDAKTIPEKIISEFSKARKPLKNWEYK